jgi:hypothetical protein
VSRSPLLVVSRCFLVTTIDNVDCRAVIHKFPPIFLVPDPTGEADPSSPHLESIARKLGSFEGKDGIFVCLEMLRTRHRVPSIEIKLHVPGPFAKCFGFCCQPVPHTRTLDIAYRLLVNCLTIARTSPRSLARLTCLKWSTGNGEEEEAENAISPHVEQWRPAVFWARPCVRPTLKVD